jgi:transposase
VSSMPQPIHHDQNDNAAGEVVLGVDTHKDLHAAAVINSLGVLLSSKMFPATTAGYRALLAWVDTFGVLRLWDSRSRPTTLSSGFTPPVRTR